MAKPRNISPSTTRLFSRWEMLHASSQRPSLLGTAYAGVPVCSKSGMMAIADLDGNEEGRAKFA